MTEILGGLAVNGKLVVRETYDEPIQGPYISDGIQDVNH